MAKMTFDDGSECTVICDACGRTLRRGSSQLLRWYELPDGREVCPGCAVGELLRRVVEAGRTTLWPTGLEEEEG